MATERTFSIIKPDATRRNLTGAITARLEEAGLRIIGQRRIRMSRDQAENFYGVHRERPFFNDLVAFMTSGPVVVQVLEGENAVARYREIMGATNPEQAAPGTIRKDFAESIEANSASPVAAAFSPYDKRRPAGRLFAFCRPRQGCIGSDEENPHQNQRDDDADKRPCQQFAETVPDPAVPFQQLLFIDHESVPLLTRATLRIRRPAPASSL